MKDEQKALGYFKESAKTNFSDGLYNYGALLLEMGDNKATALPYIQAAAQKGHTLAMFHLGLLYLEGSYMFYSCELGTSLIKSATERGPWSRKLREV